MKGREDRKQRYREAQDAAKRKAEAMEHVTVPQCPNVHLVAGGAFVEAILWVPEEK